MPRAKTEEKKGPPTASDIPDIAHEISMLEAEGRDDPNWLFALAYVKTKSPAVSYEIAFDLEPISVEDFDGDLNEYSKALSKRFVLGNALLNSPDVQVELAEFYHRLGARLNITAESLIARVWMTLNDPMTLDKEVPKLVDTILKIQNPGRTGNDDEGGGGGGSAPTVHVHINAPATQVYAESPLPLPGSASQPVIDVTVSHRAEDLVSLPAITE